MAHRSVLRAYQLDSDDSFEFAQLTIDGYSGGELQDGYRTGLILQHASEGNTLVLHADDGEINQIGTGQVTFNGNVDMNDGLDVLGGNVYVVNDVTIDGDLTVNGTETILNVESLVVEDPVQILNADGTEALTDWTGISARDADGYNRIGWVFDGYWAISSAFVAEGQEDAVPDRAIAFMGAGVTDGDLSVDAAASRIGVTEQNGVTGNNIQEALENLAADIEDSQGTDNLTWTINQDASAGVDEDPCLIMSGGDGTSLMDGYLCLITDVGGTRFEFKTYDDGTLTDSDVHINPSGGTSDIDATLTFNSGNGSDAYQASISLDGSDGSLVYTATDHEFSGDVNMLNDLDVDGALNVDGNTTLGGTLDVTGDTTMDGYVTLGDSADDHLVFTGTVYSDFDPADCTYQLGDDTHRWLDGYFCLFTPTNYSPIGSVNSLEGHLKGIDNALTGLSVEEERGVYEITIAEAVANELDSSRTVDQGDQTSVGALSDAQFRDDIFIFLNGQLLWNDPTSAANQGAVQYDVARKTGSLNTLIFGGNIRRGAVVQIVDMT
jgi:cytoskeletal protein CcmA (bactofilin family)